MSKETLQVVRKLIEVDPIVDLDRKLQPERKMFAKNNLFKNFQIFSL